MIKETKWERLRQEGSDSLWKVRNAQLLGLICLQLFQKGVAWPGASNAQSASESPLLHRGLQSTFPHPILFDLTPLSWEDRAGAPVCLCLQLRKPRFQWLTQGHGTGAGRGLTSGQLLWLSFLCSGHPASQNLPGVSAHVKRLGTEDMYKWMCVCVQLSLALCDPVNCSPPGSSVHGIF